MVWKIESNLSRQFSPYGNMTNFTDEASGMDVREPGTARSAVVNGRLNYPARLLFGVNIAFRRP